jgi:hypothetical protein
MKRKEVIVKARGLGTEAYNAGKKCIPAHDKELMALVQSPEMDAFGPDRMGRDIPVLKAWISAWTKANLDAPMPGWTEEENQKFETYQESCRRGQMITLERRLA